QACLSDAVSGSAHRAPVVLEHPPLTRGLVRAATILEPPPTWTRPGPGTRTGVTLGRPNTRSARRTASPWAGPDVRRFSLDLRAFCDLGFDDTSHRVGDRPSLSGSLRLDLSGGREHSARGGGPADGKAFDHVEEL